MLSSLRINGWNNSRRSWVASLLNALATCNFSILTRQIRNKTGKFWASSNPS
uniref:Uncharacterized protein n=1 Tax=Arundo donax TaxID=35708 RepID=A0A0A9AZ77_ARUDO